MKIDIYKILGVEKPKRVVPESDDLILLVGVSNNEITKNGSGSQIFKTFDEAKNVFPELNPEKWSENFTCSQGYEELRRSPFGIGKTKAVRFETRIANEYLSH